MTQLPTPAEILAAQVACAEAWAESRLRNGIDRMKLIYQAFPHAVDGGSAKSGLRLTWIEEQNAIGIADAGGFLTLVGDEGNGEGGDAFIARTMQQLFLLLHLESTSPGAVRELITGVPRPKTLDTSQVPKISEKKSKLTLSDLGL